MPGPNCKHPTFIWIDFDGGGYLACKECGLPMDDSLFDKLKYNQDDFYENGQWVNPQMAFEVANALLKVRLMS